MCGIAGFHIAPDDRGKINTAALVAVLGYEMMARGKDATGVATVDAKGRVRVRKKDEPANVFLAGRRGLGQNSVTAIIHTRAATQGRPEHNVNNHPIVNGNIIGIHNGVLYNDDHLYRRYPAWDRHGQVDSEAIFAAIHHLGPHRAAESLDGSWAIAWIDQTDPGRLHLARGESSPLFYMQTVAGSILFASTEDAIVEACEYGGISTDGIKKAIVKAPEGFYATIDDTDGFVIHDELKPAVDAPGKRLSKYSYKGYTPGMYSTDWDDLEDWERVNRSYVGGGSSPTTLSTQPTPTDTTKLNPYQRYTVSGDPKSPKVGDRRKYVTPNGEVHTEACIDVGSDGVARWSLLIGTTTTESDKEVTPGKASPTGQSGSTTSVAASAASGSAEIPPPSSLAEVGDYIAIPKEFISLAGYEHNNDGDMIAEVLSTDSRNGTMTIQFTRTIVDRWATDYRVIYRPGITDPYDVESDDVSLFTI
jgi:predicted glutamine amidotransferase